jgi:hypothetical protein
MRYKPMTMSLVLLIHSSCNGFFGARRLAAAAAAFQLPQSLLRHQHGSAVVSSAAFQYRSTAATSFPAGRRIHSSNLLFSSSASTSSGSGSSVGVGVISGTDDPNADDHDTTTRTNQEQQDFFETTKTFADLRIQSDVLRRRIPFPFPTKVQSITIPSIRQGTDVTIGAETGSGKVKKATSQWSANCTIFVLSLTESKQYGSITHSLRHWPISCH